LTDNYGEAEAERFEILEAIQPQVFTSKRIKISGLNPNSLSAVACDKLLGYPSKSQPFSAESGFKRRSLTI
jgi:hypothetical protein